MIEESILLVLFFSLLDQLHAIAAQVVGMASSCAAVQMSLLMVVMMLSLGLVVDTSLPFAAFL